MTAVSHCHRFKELTLHLKLQKRSSLVATFLEDFCLLRWLGAEAKIASLGYSAEDITKEIS